ncbi:hypothetical protein Emag_004672 [Eimeria magna]
MMVYANLAKKAIGPLAFEAGASRLALVGAPAAADTLQGELTGGLGGDGTAGGPLSEGLVAPPSLVVFPQAPDDRKEEGAVGEAPRSALFVVLVESGLHTAQPTQQGGLSNLVAREPPVESSSSSEEGESDEASSDESDASHGGKHSQWSVTPTHKNRGERKFDSLSAREQEKISEIQERPDITTKETINSKVQIYWYCEEKAIISF